MSKGTPQDYFGWQSERQKVDRSASHVDELDNQQHSAMQVVEMEAGSTTVIEKIRGGLLRFWGGADK